MYLIGILKRGSKKHLKHPSDHLKKFFALNCQDRGGKLFFLKILIKGFINNGGYKLPYFSLFNKTSLNFTIYWGWYRATTYQTHSETWTNLIMANAYLVAKYEQNSKNIMVEKQHFFDSPYYFFANLFIILLKRIWV